MDPFWGAFGVQTFASQPTPEMPTPPAPEAPSMGPWQTTTTAPTSAADIAPPLKPGETATTLPPGPAPQPTPSGAAPWSTEVNPAGWWDALSDKQRKGVETGLGAFGKAVSAGPPQPRMAAPTIQAPQLMTGGAMQLQPYRIR